MSIIIKYVGGEQYPYFWIISYNGANDGHGWATTEKEAVKAATNYYLSTHKWED